jgi:ERCC4-type nuclease
MFSLRCDYRENRGGCVITILRNLRAEGSIISADKYELRDEVMTTGDYAIQCGGYIILVERKTWDDLAASIKDKRIFENHKKMLAARDQGYRIMYLIEGRAPNPENSAIKVSGIPMANMMAKLDHFAMRDGVWVEYTRNASHTAQRLLELGKNMLTLETKSSAIQAAEPASASSVGGALEENKGEMPSDTSSIIRAITNPDEIIKKKYEKTVAQVREAMLGCIPGIGEKTARVMLASCPFPNLVTFSGTASALQLNTFQTSELLALSRGERPAVVIAMLTEIKGVSKSVAGIIAANFTIAKLCMRDTLTTAAIADLKATATGRRIGTKLAERISETWSDEIPMVMHTTFAGIQTMSTTTSMVIQTMPTTSAAIQTTSTTTDAAIQTMPTTSTVAIQEVAASSQVA